MSGQLGRCLANFCAVAALVASMRLHEYALAKRLTYGHDAPAFAGAFVTLLVTVVVATALSHKRYAWLSTSLAGYLAGVCAGIAAMSADRPGLLGSSEAPWLTTLFGLAMWGPFAYGWLVGLAVYWCFSLVLQRRAGW